VNLRTSGVSLQDGTAQLPLVSDGLVFEWRLSLEIFDCREEPARTHGVNAAASATIAEHLVVFSADTSYALAGDAFSVAAARRIRTIKGLTGNAPLQVLIAETGVLHGVAAAAPEDAWKLAEAFWPGPLTLIVPSSPTVEWDIGGAQGLVQVRVPMNVVAAELLAASGPLVVSAARDYQTQVITGIDDIGSLQHHVAVFLDSGVIKPEGLSTIVDLSSGEAVILRRGPITTGQIVDVLGYMPGVPDPDKPAAPHPMDQPVVVEPPNNHDEPAPNHDE
jgi:L-threonylcarbamoyladenylate synthase